MPIANCMVISNCYERALHSSDLVALWATESGKSPEHMTINILKCAEQRGNSYDVMANLLLPSLWENKDVHSLQVGLAKALAKYFKVAISDVHVTTNILSSGMVVENGEVVEW